MSEPKTLHARVIAARKKMTDPKLSGKNPHFSSKFVPLDEVLEACVPALLDEGVFVTQGVYDHELITSVHDEGGDMLRLGAYPIPPNSDPQRFMASVTYAARKSLMLAFGFRGDEDDDGNTAAKPEKAAPKPATSRHMELSKALAAKKNKNANGVLALLAEWEVLESPDRWKALTDAEKRTVLDALAPDAWDELLTMAQL